MTAARLRAELGAARARIAELEAGADEAARLGRLLRDQEERLGVIVEHIHGWEYWRAPDGRYLWVSPSCEQISGHPPGDFTQEDGPTRVRDLIHPDDRPIWDRHLLEIDEHHHDRCELDLRIVRPGGDVAWISHVCKPIFGPDGSYLGRRGCNRDISHRKDAEQRLAETRAVLMAALDQNQAGVAVMRTNGAAPTYCNQACRDLLGTAAPALLGEDGPPPALPEWSAHGADGQPLRFTDTPLGRALRQGAAQSMELTLQRPDGPDAFLLASAAPVRDDAGRTVAAMGFFVDITARKMAELSLRRSQERLLLSQDLARMGQWDLDLVTDTLDWSPGIFRIFEVDPASFAASYEGFISLVHPDDRDAVNAAYTESLRTRTNYSITHRLLLPGGKIKWVKEDCRHELDATGKPVRSIGIVQDVTEIKRTEEELRETSLYLSNLITYANAPIIVWDKELVVTKFNRAFERLTGLSSSHVLGRRLDILFPPDQAEALMRYIGETSAAGQRWESVEIPIQNADGSVKTVLWNSAAIHDSEGERIVATIAQGQDITARKAAEHELVIARDTAIKAARSKSEFLANMSHEIRTPMNGVLGLAQLLGTTILDAEQKEYVEGITESGNNLLTLVNDILDFSKAEAGRIEIVESLFALSDLCRSIPSIFKEQLHKTGIELVISLADDVPLEIVGDVGRIRQVLFNLVGNSMKFTEKGRITIEVFVQERLPVPGALRLGFNVSDTGIGIPADRLHDLFEPFTQVDGSLTRKYQGTWLGLSIVKRLVALMGGNVFITSQVGQGTTVHFDILVKQPAAADQEDAANGRAKADEAAQDPVVRGLRVLLAEDDALNQRIAKKLLEKHGASVVCVENGAEAVRAVSGGGFDLVLMDVQMPVSDGVTATRRIRALGDPVARRIPIIAMTAHAMSGDREKFLTAGMDGYIAKPFVYADLAASIARVMTEARDTEQHPPARP